MKLLSKEYLGKAKDYLELDYTPYWVKVENWEEFEKDPESLLIKWSDGNKVHSIEANRNLDIPIVVWEYQ